MARAPLDVVRVTRRGAYGFYRADRGVMHAGADLGADQGEAVYAPERMTVTHVASDNRTRPLSGYGPGAVEASGVSGYVHILGHLAASHGARVGDVIDEGALVGRVSGERHVHWEVRRGDRAPWPRATRMEDTVDPFAWLRAARATSSIVRPPDGAVREPDARAPADVRPPDSAASASGAGLWLLLLVLVRRRR